MMESTREEKRTSGISEREKENGERGSKETRRRWWKDETGRREKKQIHRKSEGERCSEKASVLYEGKNGRYSRRKSDGEREREETAGPAQGLCVPALPSVTGPQQSHGCRLVAPCFNPHGPASRPDHHHQPPTPGWARRWSQTPVERLPGEVFRKAENNMAGQYSLCSYSIEGTNQVDCGCFL